MPGDRRRLIRVNSQCRTGMEDEILTTGTLCFEEGKSSWVFQLLTTSVHSKEHWSARVTAASRSDIALPRRGAAGPLATVMITSSYLGSEWLLLDLG